MEKNGMINRIESSRETKKSEASDLLFVILQ